MNTVITHPLFSLGITCAIYGATTKLSKKIGSPLFNPLIITALILIAILVAFNGSYTLYAESTAILTRMITTATVCLAVPLYKNTQYLKRYLKPILMGCCVGVAVHALCISILSKLFELNIPLIVSLFPKSVTTGIAQELSLSYGGNPSITIPTVILTGILGATIAPSLLKYFKIHHPIAIGISMGVASHAVGTSKAVEMGELEGAMAGIALIVTGLLTILLAPIFMILVGGIL